MKDYQDALGHEIYDHFMGEDVYEIVERDDGAIATSGGPQTYFAQHKQWPPHHKRTMRFVNGRVLDIGCGAGRHLLQLQGKGLDVVGIDASTLAIEVCKLRGLQQARVLSITQASSRLGRFDTVLMMGANFGLFGDFEKARRLLKRFHTITQDGARIVAEALDPYDRTEPIHLEYHDLNRRRGRMGGQVRIRVRYKKYCTPWLDYMFVSRGEMEEILAGTGWGVRRFIDSEKGPTYIAIIEKERRG